MKANELMIGDWVYHTKYGNCQVCVIDEGFGDDPEVKIKSVNIKHKEGYDYGYRTDDTEELFPIPLTSEILKKNKFIEDTYIRTKDKFYRHEPNGFRLKVNIDSEGNFYVFDNIIIQCNYVHQLQHAMRISGIEDDFVL